VLKLKGFLAPRDHYKRRMEHFWLTKLLEYHFLPLFSYTVTI
jgi:hypothetical protein